MNVEALNREYVNRYERNAPYDFYMFYPNYVTAYDYHRDVEGHVVEIDDSQVLTHSAIRRFVRNVMVDLDLYNSLIQIYEDQTPTGKAYDFEGKKLAVRHARGDWTTASARSLYNTFRNVPVELAHNFYMCWVGGYQRNRVYYGDLVVPVARDLVGPSVRNASILPVQIVRGISTPNKVNATGLLLEDWLEYRTEYVDDEWTGIAPTSINDQGYVSFAVEGDPRDYRLSYTDSDGATAFLYFEASDTDGEVVTTDSLPEGISMYRIEEYTKCNEAENYDAF